MEFARQNGSDREETHRASPGFEIGRDANGHPVLRIWGRFPPNWIGSLSSGLSQNRIGIVSGRATKVKSVWTAEFEMEPTRFAPDPKSIDYLALARKGVDTPSTAILSLDEFVLGEPERHGGSLYLEIRAGDQIGFLGTLLNRLAFYTLFPEEMVIETVNGRIFDRFWIRGVGGCAPSDTAINTLRQKLEGWLRP